MKPKVDYTLYLCTDRALMKAATIEDSVAHALGGGVTVVQLREKDCSSREFYELAKRVKAITAARGVPLIINDRVDIALAADADGVHVGQSDLPCSVVRALVGADKLVGVSVKTVEQALQAQRDGADYIGVGAMFTTSTKTDATVVTKDELIRIRAATTLPIVIIGGVNGQTLAPFKGLGIEGIAVVSAIVSQDDEAKAARELRQLWIG